MADERTEKQKVKEITDKLEEGLKELFESEKYKSYLSTIRDLPFSVRLYSTFGGT